MIEALSKTEYNNIYNSILEESRNTFPSDRNQQLFFINAKLREKLYSKILELNQSKERIKFTRTNISLLNRNDEILWQIYKGKKYIDLAKQYKLSIAAIQKIVRSTIREIVGDIDKDHTPKQLLEFHKIKIEKYFVIERNKKLN